ncbi:hypothetical protein QBC41DRAFT_122500 [Cercophora samala]|uniref:Uncharacterized protein n=1 Tax=Cercophora samala TaxID=330535 RepID=A0AA39ZDH8_9PEZI|nr:hypothetical protein QBC41DRAFT_122500 [Cercophora samala]
MQRSACARVSRPSEAWERQLHGHVHPSPSLITEPVHWFVSWPFCCHRLERGIPCRPSVLSLLLSLGMSRGRSCPGVTPMIHGAVLEIVHTKEQRQFLELGFWTLGSFPTLVAIFGPREDISLSFYRCRFLFTFPLFSFFFSFLHRRRLKLVMVHFAPIPPPFLS